MLSLSRFNKIMRSSPMVSSITNRRMGGGGGGGSHGWPHVADHHLSASKFMLVTCYVWILYRMKEDGAHVFGIDRPWYNLPAEGEEGDSHH